MVNSLCYKAQATATGALSMAQRSYPRPRSGAEARRTPCPKGGGQEELPHVRGQGQRPRVPDCEGAGTAKRSYPASEVGGRPRGDNQRTRSGAAMRGVTPRP